MDFKMTLALVILALVGAEVVDLGVMTDRRVIILEKCTNRTDFAAFQVELQSLLPGSNYVSYTSQAGAIEMEDFASIPQGPVAVGVTMICADGEKSQMALYRLDLRRSAPRAPVARMVTLLNPNLPAEVPEATNAPARPLAIPMGRIRQVAVEGTPPPLPESKMNLFYEEREGQRRNE